MKLCISFLMIIGMALAGCSHSPTSRNIASDGNETGNKPVQTGAKEDGANGSIVYTLNAKPSDPRDASLSSREYLPSGRLTIFGDTAAALFNDMKQPRDVDVNDGSDSEDWKGVTVKSGKNIRCTKTPSIKGFIFDCTIKIKDVSQGELGQ